MNTYEIVKNYETDFLSDLERLIKIPSIEGESAPSAPFGIKPMKALKEALTIGEEHGFCVKNLDNYIGYIEMGEAEKYIAILCHVDVVGAGENWETPPFRLTRKGDSIFGRGVSDDKGPLIAALYAMQYLKDTNYPLKKRIRLIIGTNEETGSKCVEYYKTKEPLPEMGFSPDSDFPLIYGEKGIVHLKLSAKENEDAKIRITQFEAGEAANVVCPKARVTLSGKNIQLDILSNAFEGYLKAQELKGYAERENGTLTMVLEGKAYHASIPEKGVNAAMHLTMFLASFLDSPLLKALRDLIALDTDGEKLGINMQDEHTRLTENIGLVNYKDGVLSAMLDIRYPITTDFTSCKNEITHRFALYNVDVEIINEQTPLYIPIDSPLCTALWDSYKEVSGDECSKPLAIGGGTYAKAFPNVVAYGAVFPNEDTRMHMPDEQTKVSSLLKATAIYIKALQKLNEL